MINLLPYSRRALMKSLYKKRLIVVAFVTVSISLLPLVLVLLVLSYIENIDYKFLNNQYTEISNLSKNDGAADLAKQIKTVNTTIRSFQGSINQSRIVSNDIEKISELRPADIRISNLNFSQKGDKHVLVISGISGTRDSIIKYGTIIDKSNGGICADVNVPVTTYAKRVEVPFIISCEIDNETK